MSTWELLSDKEKKKYLEDARKAAKDLKEICEHCDDKSGYCYEYKEACYYEEQNLCPDYAPKYVNVKYKNRK